MSPFNEDKTAKLNQINAGRTADMNTSLTSPSGQSTFGTEPFQMNGDDGDFLPTESKCRSKKYVSDLNV